MPNRQKRTSAQGYHAGEFARRVRELFRQRQRSPRHVFGRYHDLQELKLSVLFHARGQVQGCDFSPAATFSNLSGEDIRRDLPEIMQTLRGVRFSRAVFQKAADWVQSVALSRDAVADFTARLNKANMAILQAAGNAEGRVAARPYTTPTIPTQTTGNHQAPAFADLERAFSELRAELERTRRTFDGTPPEEPEDSRSDAGMYQVDQGEPPDPADWWKPGFRG